LEVEDVLFIVVRVWGLAKVDHNLEGVPVMVVHILGLGQQV
jgi:hypothetical protein